MSADKPTKTAADVAHFYRAVGRAHDERMPMPTQIQRRYGDSMMLEFDRNRIDAVDAWAKLIGVEVGHGRHTHVQGDRQYHAYGTQFTTYGHWTGWPVQLVCFVDGPSPVEHKTSIQQTPGGPIEVLCSCGQWGGVAPSQAEAERSTAAHEADPSGRTVQS